MAHTDDDKSQKPDSEEREETIKDLDVPEDESEDVKGGAYSKTGIWER